MKVFILKKSRITLVMNIITAIFVVATLSVGAAVNSVMASKGTTPILRVNTEDKRVAVTMNLDKYIDVKRLCNVIGNRQVTFFASGYYAVNYYRDLAELCEKGYTVGLLEQDMKNKSRNEINDALAGGIELVSNITGKNIEIIRFDKNIYDSVSVNCVLNVDLFPVQWSADEYSEEFLSGDIVCVSDIQSLKETLQRVDKSGYKTASVDELLYKNDFSIDINGVQVKKPE